MRRSSVSPGITCRPVECDDTDDLRIRQDRAGIAPLYPGRERSLIVCPKSRDVFAFDIQADEGMTVRGTSSNGEPVRALLLAGDGSGSALAATRSSNGFSFDFETFPEHLIHDSAYAVLVVWPAGDLDAATYSLNLQVD